MVKLFTITCPTCSGADDTSLCVECGGSGKIPARPFSTVSEMNEKIIEFHNRVVGKSDHSWCLGDVVMGRNAHDGHQMAAIVKRLQGKRRLILGNHDQLAPKFYAEAFEKVRGASRIDNLIFTHIPIAIESIPVGCVNVHGHTHTQCLKGPYINVSLEVINYIPRSLEELRGLAETVRTLHPQWDTHS